MVSEEMLFKANCWRRTTDDARRTSHDARRTLANGNSSPWAYGSGELKTSFDFEIWVTFDQGQRMTLTFDTHSTS